MSTTTDSVDVSTGGWEHGYCGQDEEAVEGDRGMSPVSIHLTAPQKAVAKALWEQHVSTMNSRDFKHSAKAGSDSAGLAAERKGGKE